MNSALLVFAPSSKRGTGDYAALVELLTDLALFRVTLRDEGIVDVWASSYSEADGYYVFQVLVRSDGEPADVLVTARTPSDPSRFIIALARIPIAQVAKILSA